MTSLLGVVLLGVAMIWMVKLVYANRNRSADLVQRGLWAAGWILIFVGLFAGFYPFLPLLGWLILLLIILMAVNQYRRAEGRTLAGLMAIATRHGVPLHEAAAAFAAERVDEMGLRAARLSELLEAGLPLREALRQSHQPMPLDVVLAAQYGTEMNMLGPALHWVVHQVDELDMVLRGLFEKAFYLLTLVCVGGGIFAFMMIKIVPVYERLLVEFEVPVPQSTQLLLSFSNAFTNWGLLLIPFLALLLLVLVLAGLHYIGWLPYDLPIVHRFARRLDAARIMQCLALAVGQQRSTVEALILLAHSYPKFDVRRKLYQALESIRAGGDWCDSLARVGLFSAADAGVLQAAQRAGNLHWALTELADSNLRRLNYRVRGLLSVLFPLALLLMGLCVLLVAAGMFLPLIDLLYRLL